MGWKEILSLVASKTWREHFPEVSLPHPHVILSIIGQGLCTSSFFFCFHFLGCQDPRIHSSGSILYIYICGVGVVYGRSDPHFGSSL